MVAMLLLVLAYFCVRCAADDEITMPKDEYESIVGHLKNLKAIDEATPEITFEPIVIYRGYDGEYYFPEKTEFDMKLAYKVYHGDLRLPVRVERKKRSSFRFGQRVSIGGQVEEEDGNLVVGFAANYELIGLSRLSIGPTLSTKSLSMSVGFRVTENSTAMIGFGVGLSDIFKLDVGRVTIGYMLGL